MWLIPGFFAPLWGSTEYLLLWTKQDIWGCRFGLWDLFQHFLTFYRQINWLLNRGKQWTATPHSIKFNEPFFIDDILNGGDSQVRIIKLMMGWIPISCFSFKVQASCISARCPPCHYLVGNLNRTEAFFVTCAISAMTSQNVCCEKGLIKNNHGYTHALWNTHPQSNLLSRTMTNLTLT